MSQKQRWIFLVFYYFIFFNHHVALFPIENEFDKKCRYWAVTQKGAATVQRVDIIVALPKLVFRVFPSVFCVGVIETERGQ